MMNSNEVLILFSLYITILLEKSQKKRVKPHLDSWRMSNIRVLQALDLSLVKTIFFFCSLWNFQGNLHTSHKGHRHREILSSANKGPDPQDIEISCSSIYANEALQLTAATGLAHCFQDDDISQLLDFIQLAILILASCVPRFIPATNKKRKERRD